MIYKLISNVAGVLLALVALELAAVPGASPMAYTVSSPVSMTLRWVPGGELRMGDLAGVGQKDEQPVRTVTVDGFWMMETEVTVGMFQRFVDGAGYDMPEGCGYFADGWKLDSELTWASPGFSQSSDHPVTCVSWQDAMAFGHWLSRETGLEFALPNESQWEYAARAGSRSLYAHGNAPDLLCQQANGADRRALEDYPNFDVNDCDDGYARTAPVTSYPANGWGLYDMTGNVWEWVTDCWPADYALAPRDGSAFTGGDCERRGYRGGAYGDLPYYLRISLRNRGYPDERRDDVGFRLVLNRW